jgi:hypothetical protein
MTLYENGKAFQLVILLQPPDSLQIPYAVVDMAIPKWGNYVPVVGKVDTGAFNTSLQMETAANMGITDPKGTCLKEVVGYTANGAPIKFYVHQVIVKVTDLSGDEVTMVLYPGFADRLKNNLFGRDWLNHFCLAVDFARIHLLRD